MLAGFFSNVRLSVRQLAASPSFSLPTVFGLALAIAATTAAFSILYVTMLNSPGGAHADRVVAIWGVDAKRGQKQVEASYEDLVQWSTQSNVLNHVALASSVNLDFPIHGDGMPIQVDGSTVSGRFFELLGARPIVGRLLNEGDDVPNGPMRVVISHRLWQSRFGGDPQIAGRQIRGGEGSATIVGVAGPEFDFPHDVDMWAPLRASWPTVEQQKHFRVFRAVARLKPGVAVESAQAQLNALASRLAAGLPPGVETYPVVVRPLVDEIYGQARHAIWTLAAAVCLVLVIACVNAANLLLARATARGQEFAVRAAIGASRAQLAQVLITEAFVLSAASCAAGMALAWALIRVIAALAPAEVPRIDAVSMNPAVLLFGIGVSLLTIVLFGIGPAVLASRKDPGFALKESGERTTAGRGQGRLRSSLVMAEIALSLILVVAGGLLVRSFWKLSSVDPGFDPQRVLTFRVTTGLPDQEKRRALYSSILERVEALPGVESAGAVLLRPLSGLVGWDGVYMVEGQSPEDQKGNPSINYQAISPGYFRTMRIGMLAGRDFSRADTDTAPGVVILNESAAKRHWPAGNAVGQRLRLGTNTKAPALTVVGVVRDVRYREWEAVRPDFYVPFTQRAQHRSDFVVKTSGSPEAMADAIRRAVFEIDKTQPVSQVTTMERLVDRALSRGRFAATVLAALAITALLLASIGVYGVLAYTVEQRRHEIGIRSAIGATPSQLMQHLVADGLRMAVAGTAVGLILALGAGRLMLSLLYDVSPFDWRTYAGALAVTLALALAACAIPAWRAAREDALTILKAG